MGTLHVCFADTTPCGRHVATTTATPPIDDMAGDAAMTSPRPQPELHSISPSSSVSPTPRFERNMSFFQQLSRRFGLRSSDDPIYSAEDDSTDSCSSTASTMPPMQCSSATSMSSSSSNNNALRPGHCHNGSGAQAAAKDSHGSSMEHISCASSETSSSVDMDEQQPQATPLSQQTEQAHKPNTSAKERKSSARTSFSRLHRRSTSSIRRAFESFSLSSRSLSCSGATPPPPATSNGGTPIKSALKSSSAADLNKRSNSVTLTAATTTTAASMPASTKLVKSKPKPPPQRILRQPVSYTYLKGISGLPTQRVPRNAVCCQYARR